MAIAKPTKAADLEHLQRLLREVYAGHRWLVAMDILQSAMGFAGELQRLGATDVFAVASAIGAGRLQESIPHAALRVTADTMMESIRSREQALTNLPGEILARIDTMDPDRTAHVVRTIFSDGGPIAGRRCWGGRPERWRALEDKTIIDAVWDACGVPRADSRVVPNDLPTLQEAHAALDRGAGTVWSADNRDGWHGGATGLRWVRSSADLQTATHWMRDHAHRVRVMPFLEGIPCSIHGIVFDDWVVAVRPCEMVVLRQPDSLEFRYARVATFWDPPAADRDEMRHVVRKVGRHIRTTIGYRGVFTIDGIMTRDGFRPTELNPRFGAALWAISKGIQSLDLYLLHLAIIERPELDWRPKALEALLVECADAHRHGSAMQMLPNPCEVPRKAGLVPDATGWRVARDGESAHASATLEPSPGGSLLRVELAPEHTPNGPPTAPRTLAMMATLAHHWNLDMPTLLAARSVR